MPTFNLKELSVKLNEPFEGNGSVELTGVAPIETAKEGEISFVANPKYVSKVSQCKASALIVPKDLETDFTPVIRSSNPYLTFTKALSLFHEGTRRISGGVHSTSLVSDNVQFGKDVTVMANSVVESNVAIGDRTILYPGVFLGEGAVIGNDATLYPNVTVYAGCRVGDRAILHSGCRIGSTGTVKDSINPVVLENDIELGANVVVSGLSEAPSIIHEGTKIDNLVHIGIGTSIGPHCIIVAQVTIGDQVTLEEQVTIAGQVVISPGVVIGAGSRIGAKSVVQEDVPPQSDYWGIPAQPHHQEKRQKANIIRLPKFFEKIQSLEKKLEDS